jgi:3-deoxy-7-phosphoheptulonate synthase
MKLVNQIDLVGVDMVEFNNKFPGKDVSQEDIETKFPLVAKQSASHKSIFTVAGVEFGGNNIPVFAGPNMVESEELIVNIASNLSQLGVSFLRGGAFKPLSFPYRNAKYTETRELGIEFLKTAKQESGLPVITELLDERHLDLVCEVSDILQIGSRNMQNYPLLTAAAKSGVPIMLKRHYGASLRDWLGAAEYIMVEGNEKVLLCERGMAIPHTHRSTSRFSLDLQVVPAAQELTHLPIVTDPSHATFWAPWVKPMTLASIACGADAVMVEVHPSRAEAAVDPLQPLEFDEFADLLKVGSSVAQSLGRTFG